MPSVSILGEANVQRSMVKNAIKREQSQACLSYAEREHFRQSQCSMVNDLTPPRLHSFLLPKPNIRFTFISSFIIIFHNFAK